MFQQAGKTVSGWHDIGVGPTDELSLRVSVASLVRVVFADPGDGNMMLTLERKATFHPADGYAIVKVQPFGGALRINRLHPLKDRIGDFHFDSQQSRSEQDFRIYIRPTAWEAVRDFCLEQFGRLDGSGLESGPERELAEEFGDALSVNLRQNQYECNPLWTILENEPAPSDNIYATNQPTVRVYRVFEARLTDPALVTEIRLLTQRYSNLQLEDLAREDARTGGRGRANAILVIPLDQLVSFYQALPEAERNSPTTFEGCPLEPNITTLLNGSILAPKYLRV